MAKDISCIIEVAYFSIIMTAVELGGITCCISTDRFCLNMTKLPVEAAFVKIIAFFVGIFSFIPKVRGLRPEIPYFSENFHVSFKKFKNMKLLSASVFLPASKSF